jgi:hypothetical protein
MRDIRRRRAIFSTKVIVTSIVLLGITALTLWDFKRRLAFSDDWGCLRPGFLCAEVVFLPALTLFALWPWLRSKPLPSYSLHLGLTPFVLLAPYWLGYRLDHGSLWGASVPLYHRVLSHLPVFPLTVEEDVMMKLFPQPLEFLSPILPPPVLGSAPTKVGLFTGLFLSLVFAALPFASLGVRGTFDWLCARARRPAIQ